MSVRMGRVRMEARVVICWQSTRARVQRDGRVTTVNWTLTSAPDLRISATLASVSTARAVSSVSVSQATLVSDATLSMMSVSPDLVIIMEHVRT